MRLPISVVDEWCDPEPVPSSLRVDFTLDIQADGNVDLSPMIDACEDELIDQVLRHKWEICLRRGCILQSGSKVARLSDLVCVSFTEGLMALHCQLVVHMCNHAERVGLHCIVKGRETKGSLDFGVVNILDVLNDRRQLDFQILRHVLASRDLLGNQLHLNWLADKKSIFGMQLFNSVFATASNDGVVGLPQARNKKTWT